MLAAWMLYATLLTSLIYLGALAAETIVGIWGGRRRLVWAFSLLAAMSAPIVLATRHAAPAAASGAARFVVQSSARLAPALPRMETALSTVSDDRGPVRRGQVSPIAQIAATVEPYLVGTWLGSSALLLSSVACADGRRAGVRRSSTVRGCWWRLTPARRSSASCARRSSFPPGRCRFMDALARSCCDTSSSTFAPAIRNSCSSRRCRWCSVLGISGCGSSHGGSASRWRSTATAACSAPRTTYANTACSCSPSARAGAERFHSAQRS